MKRILFTTLILIPLLTFGQGITFEVEELSKPERPLLEESYDDIYKKLILEDANLSDDDLGEYGIDFQYQMSAKSKAPDSLVNYGFHSFFNGMYQAYADHRPFVLSPDMIWLLISQGFARHVNANPEKLRKYFVDFSGKLSLTVKVDTDILNDPDSWEKVFPQFTTQIAQHTGDNLINTLTADFSTTTAVEKVASEITIMEAMEPYFEYMIFYSVCGIPEITLQGTTEDWKKVLKKTKKLGKYELKWWTKELEPILKEFVKASQGHINKRFWRNMFKYHSKKRYGAPEVIDGWIVKFFPYNKDGKRKSLNKISSFLGDNDLPEEMVKVDVLYIKTDGVHTEKTMLELWAGFIGLEQNKETFALTPQISWMVKEKTSNQSAMIQKLDACNQPDENNTGIELSIYEVPEVLKMFDTIYSLSLYFKKRVFIPEWMKTKTIGKLVISGKISKREKKKILEWFPYTEIYINGDNYYKGQKVRF